MVTVLMIEDDMLCARMVEKILKAHDFEFHHAPTGLSGLKLAREISPDIILVDINLPDLDGKVVALQLHGAHSKKPAPIVAFTAEDSDKARRIALRFGCDSFLSKSMDTRTFPDQLRQIIANFQKGKGNATETHPVC